MKIATITKQHDADNEPIAIVFENDQERLHVANLLLQMQPSEGVRIFTMYPKTIDQNTIKTWLTELSNQNK